MLHAGARPYYSCQLLKKFRGLSKLRKFNTVTSFYAIYIQRFPIYLRYLTISTVAYTRYHYWLLYLNQNMLMIHTCSTIQVPHQPSLLMRLLLYPFFLLHLSRYPMGLTLPTQLWPTVQCSHFCGDSTLESCLGMLYQETCVLQVHNWLFVMWHSQMLAPTFALQHLQMVM